MHRPVDIARADVCQCRRTRNGQWVLRQRWHLAASQEDQTTGARTGRVSRAARNHHTKSKLSSGLETATFIQQAVIPLVLTVAHRRGRASHTKPGDSFDMFGIAWLPTRQRVSSLASDSRYRPHAKAKAVLDLCSLLEHGVFGYSIRLHVDEGTWIDDTLPTNTSEISHLT